MSGGYFTFTHEQWGWIMRMSGELSKREYGVLMVVLRYTHGFHRKEARLSGSYFKAACGIWPTHVPATLKKLKEKGIINLLPKERNTNVVFFDWEAVLTPTKTVGVDTTKSVGSPLPKRLQSTTESVIKPYRIGREERKEEKKEENKDKIRPTDEQEYISAANSDSLF